jgi:hypothetical protein
VYLGFNEIHARGGIELARAMRNKDKLIHLDLGGNMFGETGRQELQFELKDTGRLNALGSLRSVSQCVLKVSFSCEYVLLEFLHQKRRGRAQ